MFYLYGQGGYDITQPYCLSDEALDSLLFNASQILVVRGETQAAGLLAALKFDLYEATNGFGDEFTVMETQVALRQYEYLREAIQNSEINLAFSQIADVVTEISSYIRYIACKLDESQPPENWRSDLTSAVSNLNANQAVFTFRDSPKIIHEGINFRSKTEIKIYEALVKKGLFVLPLPLAVLGKRRRYKEPDFIVCYRGKWGILEIHGDKWHPPETAAQEHERRREFMNLGISIYEIFGSDRCWNDPDGVVNDFLKAFSNN